MKAIEIKPGIHWVGGIDWDIREFHGYLTQRGSTYNAYLIIDEKTVLVDTVKHYLCDEMLARIKQVVDPSEIDIIISNHTEMDHSGCIPKIMEVAPNAKIYASVAGEKGLRKHFKKDLDITPVKSGETLNIGKRTLQFFHTAMVHWPDNMVTYIPEDKLLLSNDAFGQHIASAERFDDEIGWDIVREEAAKYYANIVLPYGDRVQKALEALSGLDIDMIAPSHGIIHRSYLSQILDEYDKWSAHRTEEKALIVYDTMWGSTERMASALADGLEDAGLPVTMRPLSADHISDVMTNVLDSKVILIGSPTMNNSLLPTLGAFLVYIIGLKPKDRVGFAFGSYGWGGQAVGEIEGYMQMMNWDMPQEGVKIKYVPDEEELDNLREIGRKLGEHAKGSSE